MASRYDKLQYSVLVMGKTQAGKSTLVEHIKNYANPNYTIDPSLLGNGNLSKTESTRPFYVESNLPAYEAFRKDTNEVIELEGLATRWEEEEDYRDILFSREKDVGLRRAPQDPNDPSELVEFRFLDTPGLNDTRDRDSSHAVNIISEMISTRSFNLIVIIVSYKNPLTQEQQLALEYYANVFKGLHTRIMFLHTHVDYADIHHTNKVHNLNMKMRNKALSKMFRRFDGEGIIDEDNVKEYSSLTIDLVSKKRPVINCLIRNTIREILKMATEPAVHLDTSIQNIERIRAITHPSKFNDEERKRAAKLQQAKEEKLQQAEEEKLQKQAEEEQVNVGGEDLEQINILLIGDVQSGKTSLVETFRHYADTNYIANTQHITKDNRSSNETVKITSFLADLHTVQIRRLKTSTYGYDVVDLDEEVKTLSEEDFEDLLNLGPKHAETVIIGSNGTKKYRFNIYEGPSLNESDENYEKYIFSIHQIIVESEAHFHQVLFTLAPGPITGARSILRTFCDIFSDINSLFSFVHTKIDYPKLHIGNKQFQDSMKERTELLQEYIQSSAAPYMIYCNLQSNWPVQRAKTYNVVHDILRSAIGQTPIELGRSLPATPDIPVTVTPEYTILVLGRSQSGKSTLVEHIKSYADSVEVISNLKAMHIPHTIFQSNLPTYEAIQKDNGAILNVTHLADIFSEDDSGFLEYHELLRSSKRNFVSRLSPPMTSLPQPKTPTYMIMDTPGISNSDRESTPEGKARSHMVPKADEMEEHPSFTLDLRSDEGPIIHCLNRNTIREILYLAASNSPRSIDTSDENMDRIRTIPYPKNFTESQKRKLMESISTEDEKQKILSVADDRLGRSYSLKDTSFHKTRSIYRELVDPATSSGRSLRHARSLSTPHIPNTPKLSVLKKSSRIVAVDALLLKKVQDAFQDIPGQINKHSGDRLEFTKKIQQLDLDYKTKDPNGTKYQSNFASRDDMEVVFEDRHKFAAEPYPELYTRSMTFKEQCRVIEHVSIQMRNIDIEHVVGGQGFHHWSTFYRRNSGAAASLTVKIYTKKLDGNNNPIGETASMTRIRIKRTELEQKLAMTEARLKDLAHVQKEYNLSCDWIGRETLPRAVVEELNETGMYESKNIPFDKIKEVYLKAGGVYTADSWDYAAGPAVTR
ncbi:hypothetical protein BG005_011607 [Podila minutissima]|nr:hypothetical protein BG005_011607 [Podila minutissima]